MSSDINITITFTFKYHSTFSTKKLHFCCINMHFTWLYIYTLFISGFFCNTPSFVIDIKPKTNMMDKKLSSANFVSTSSNCYKTYIMLILPSLLMYLNSQQPETGLSSIFTQKNISTACHSTYFCSKTRTTCLHFYYELFCICHHHLNTGYYTFNSYLIIPGLTGSGNAWLIVTY